MHPGDGDDTRSRAKRQLRLSPHPARMAKAVAALIALAGLRCSGGDDDGVDFDGSAGQWPLPAGTGGSAGVAGSGAGGSPSAGTTQLPGGTPGTSGSSGASGNASAGGTSGGSGGKSSAGSGGSATAGQSGGGVAGAGNGNAGRGGSAAGGGSGGRGGRGSGAASGAGTAGTSGSGATGGSGQSWNVQGTLAAHNDVRAMVTMGDDLPALTWSIALADVAQDWADTLADECDGIRHRMPNEYGENIAAQWFFGSAPAPSAERYGPEAVAAWAEEIECWTYGTIAGTETCNQQCIQMQNSSGCGHYTQLVWRNSQRVGCGYATCDPMQGDLMEIFVCNYDPPGNYRGQAPY